MSSVTFPHNPSQVPERLQSEAFTIRPLRVEHVELDYDAVMSSRKMLRAWSQSTWPADDFTLAGNLADLERHQREHETGVAYTYTIMQADEARCLGCLYIHPVPQELLIERPAPGRETISGMAAYVRFWVRSSLQGSSFEGQLLSTLISWFKLKWSLETLFFRASPEHAHQQALFASAGLGLAHDRLVLDNPKLAWLVYA